MPLTYQPGDGGGVAMAVHNTRESIDGFARAASTTRYNAAGRRDHVNAVGHAASRGFQMFGLRFASALATFDRALVAAIRPGCVGS